MTAVDPNDRVARALRQLPAIVAPATLLPRVMAAVQAWAGRPWYQRAWFTWPIGWQLAAVVGLVLVAASAAVVIPNVETGPAAASVKSARDTFLSHDVLMRLETLWMAARVLGQALHPVLVYAFVIVAAMTAMCLMVAVTLNRAVCGRT